VFPEWRQSITALAPLQPPRRTHLELLLSPHSAADSTAGSVPVAALFSLTLGGAESGPAAADPAANGSGALLPWALARGLPQPSPRRFGPVLFCRGSWLAAFRSLARGASVRFFSSVDICLRLAAA